MIPLEKLLQPVSKESVAGEDPHQSGALLELEQSITGTEATEDGGEPDWRKVADKALGILERARDLRVGVILALASLKKEKLRGFREALELLCGFVEKFWDSVFPVLDSEDPLEDPSRANALNNLSPPLGKEGAYRFITCLRQIPLTCSQRLGSYCLRDILRAEGKVVAGADEKPVTLPQIEGAFRDSAETSGESLREAGTELQELLRALGKLQSIYEERCGEGITPTLDTLRGTLEEMAGWVGRYATAPSSGTDRQGTGPTSRPEAAPPVAATRTGSLVSAPGSIASPEDVKATLRSICDYYKDSDRSSPVPFLLERALRLLDKDFLQSVGDLAPEAVKELNKLFGLTGQAADQKKP